MVVAARIGDVTSKLEEAILETRLWDRKRVYAVDWNNSEILYRNNNDVYVGDKIAPFSMVRPLAKRISDIDNKAKRARIIDRITGFNYPLARTQSADDSPGFHTCFFRGRVVDIATIEMFADDIDIPSDPIIKERIMAKPREFEVWYDYCDESQSHNNGKIARTLENCRYAMDVMDKYRDRLL
jgi:hypothetical protein